VKLKPTERVQRAEEILGPDSAKDVDAAIADIEKAAQESCSSVPANWRGLLRHFQQDLRRVQGDIRRPVGMTSGPFDFARLRTRGFSQGDKR